jgi:hypothetical protein
MLSRLVRPLALALCLSASGAEAQTLPLPDNLTALNSQQGEQFFFESSPHQAYFAVADSFETEQIESYCGVASMVMVLNALQLPAPSSPQFAPYHIFTQDNVLDAQTDAILPRDEIAKEGMTLEQFGAVLALHPLALELHHAAAGGLDAFRTSARDYLAAPDHFVIVNFSREALSQEGGGHFSPLAAYDAKADRFLMLDVARYKYPPVWVKTADLFAAMNTTDSVSNQTRGYVLITKTGLITKSGAAR